MQERGAQAADGTFRVRRYCRYQVHGCPGRFSRPFYSAMAHGTSDSGYQIPPWPVLRFRGRLTVLHGRKF
jgi:hypothetical protein